MNPFLLPLGGLIAFLFGAAITLLCWARRRRAHRPVSLPSVRYRIACATGIVIGLSGAFGLVLSDLDFGWHGDATVKPDANKETKSELYAVASRFMSPVIGTDNVGASVALLSDGQQALFGFGVTEVGGDEPDGDTMYEVGSISKALTGVLLAEAVERGELTPEQPITTLLPEASAIPQRNAGESITLEHLVTHTAGLPTYPPGFLTVGCIGAFVLGGDPYRGIGREQVLAFFPEIQLDPKPGAQYRYSNVGAAMLGMALARRGDTTFEGQLRERICQPLGMEDTAIALRADQRTRLAQGYLGQQRLGPLGIARRSQNWDLPDALASAGGVRSTAKDMLRFLAANMGAYPSSLDPALARAQTRRFDIDARRGMAMGWRRDRWKDLGQDVIWHDGKTGGYRGFIAFTADRRHGVVILSNTAKDCLAAGFGMLRELARVTG